MPKNMIADVGISVFYNREEGWINVLTCHVGARDLRPVSVEVYPYSDELQIEWSKRALREPNTVYVFSCNRVV